MPSPNTPEFHALLLTAEENYAHARDHEMLRAQITTILVSAAFVLIGLGLDKLEGTKLVFIALVVILIGALNLWIVCIHNNRFDRHVSIAREAKKQIADVTVQAGVAKRHSLALAWSLVACLPIIAGVTLLATCRLASQPSSSTGPCVVCECVHNGSRAPSAEIGKAASAAGSVSAP
jgi:hypothetical protein